MRAVYRNPRGSVPGCDEGATPSGLRPLVTQLASVALVLAASVAMPSALAVLLLIPLGTVAFQSLAELRVSQPDRVDSAGRPMKVDSCYAYRAEGQVVMQRWPQWRRAEGAHEDRPGKE